LLNDESPYHRNHLSLYAYQDSPLIGKTLSHYKISAEIGKGGMGEVYRARDTKLGREVALKLLPGDFASDPDRLHRFEREARVLASLSHQNIATIHGFEQDGEHRFLVLELVEGEDLAQRLARGRVRTQEALSIARQIAEGMEAAHERGIIHRDLKPANIKQSTDGVIKILDFGLARADVVSTSPDDIENSPTVTQHTDDNALLGTAPYMSPEQLRGHTVDARADIWAFGCVLYQMLTGVSPFAANSTPEVMARILDHEPAFDALPEDLPATARQLLRRCLAKDPHQRMHSAADIRIVLQEALELAPETEVPGVRTEKKSGIRTGIVALAAFALGAVAIGLFSLQGGPKVEDTRHPVRLMIPVRDDASVVPMPEASSVAISPDGTVVVYVAAGGSAGLPIKEGVYSKTQLYRRPIDSFRAVAIEGTTSGGAPFFSPDGQWIGFFDFNRSVLRKVARAGGVPVDICFVNGLSFRGGYWTEDGKIYFSDAVGLFVVDENGGAPEELASPSLKEGIKTYRFPDLLPGSHSLLFALGSSEILSYDDADIALLDLESGDVRVLARGGCDPQYVPTGHIIFGRAGNLYALPFDLERLEVTGPPVLILKGVVTSDGYGSMHMSCSRDGTLLYVAGGPEQFSTEISILDSDGRLERIPQPERPYGNVRLSPDAKRFAVSVLGANASLWVYDLQRGTLTKLISGWDNFAPVWNNSGDMIAFGSNRSGRNGIWLTRPDGSGSPKLLSDQFLNEYPNSWSPDDRMITYSGLQTETNGMDVWVVTLDGEQIPIASTPARELRGFFSPDGRYIAYTSDESGRLEIYVQAFPVTGRKWKLSEDGGELPLWSREGDRIYYWNEQRLMSVTVELDPEFKPARARVMIEADIEVHDYDVFPGGERFLVLGRSSTRERAAASIARGAAQGRLFPAQSPDLRVVLNWFDELARSAHGEAIR
jgi:serine/threonine protein kinase/Tol biopolymer transport system component